LRTGRVAGWSRTVLTKASRKELERDAVWNRRAAASNSRGRARWDAASDTRMAWGVAKGAPRGWGVRKPQRQSTHGIPAKASKERRPRKTRTSGHDWREPHSFTLQALRHGPHAQPTRRATRPTARTAPNTVAGPQHPPRRKCLSITAKTTPQHHNKRPATPRLRPPPKTPAHHHHQTNSNQRPSRQGATRAKDTPQTQGGRGHEPPPSQRPRSG